MPSMGGFLQGSIQICVTINGKMHLSYTERDMVDSGKQSYITYQCVTRDLNFLHLGYFVCNQLEGIVKHVEHLFTKRG